jgi:hypothetical protein
VPLAALLGSPEDLEEPEELPAPSEPPDFFEALLL